MCENKKINKTVLNRVFEDFFARFTGSKLIADYTKNRIIYKLNSRIFNGEECDLKFNLKFHTKTLVKAGDALLSQVFAENSEVILSARCLKKYKIYKISRSVGDPS